jgi:hypothetical protein
MACAAIAQAPSPVQFRPESDAIAAIQLQTCWYDAHGNLTGATPAAMGAKAGNKVQANSGGDHAWSYTVEGHDASVCPSKLPVSTISQQ